MPKVLHFMGFLTLLLWLCASAFSAQAQTLVLDNQGRIGKVSPSSEFLEDPQGEYTLEQVTGGALAGQWQPGSDSALNLGYTDSAYWVRFELATVSQDVREWLLEIHYPVLEQLDVYQLRGGQLKERFRMGSERPFQSRPVNHPNFVIPVSVHPGENTQVILRVQSSTSVQLPMRLWEPQAFISNVHGEVLVDGLFYGALLIMALYNLLIFFSVRDVSYLYYVLYVVSMATLVGGISGVTFKFLWPETEGLNQLSILLALSGNMIFPSLFTRSFLEMPGNRPFLSWLLSLMIALGVLCAIGSLFFSYKVMVQGILFLSLVSIVVHLASGVVRLRDGYAPARYYLVAWSFILAGAAILIFNKMAILPRNGFTESAMQWGMVMELLLLSFALAHRMTVERQMREKAQLESAQAQHSLLVSQRKVNEELDRMVRQRTSDLQEANHKLQAMSRTDGLTGLHNRRSFDEVFVQEYRRAFRDAYPIAVIMIDIDHFKAVNDAHGHPFGDECLRIAGQLIEHCVKRPSDLAARYGGEEFVALLPNTDLEGALTVARQIHRAFEEETRPFTDGSSGMTVSLGVASGIPGERDSHETLLSEADSSLYRAKENGRNQVQWVESEGVEPEAPQEPQAT
ncbi:MAG: diguanylate cyclase [Oleiphilaceae bacterium]|nr:diguanylate cyclase [Oleiphilaceae bacterium]